MQLKLPQKPLFKERINQSANIHSVGLHCKPGHSSGRHRCLHRQHMGQQAALFSPNSPLPGRKHTNLITFCWRMSTLNECKDCIPEIQAFSLDTQCIISTPSTIIFILKLPPTYLKPQNGAFFHAVCTKLIPTAAHISLSRQNLRAKDRPVSLANFQNYHGFIHFQAIIHLGFLFPCRFFPHLQATICQEHMHTARRISWRRRRAHQPGDEEGCTNQR